MKLEHSTLNVSFQIENCLFHTLNMTHYLLNYKLPDHCHASNCYEIHYIINGSGKLKINNQYFDLKPNIFFMNGPHVVHSYTPYSETPISEYVIQLRLEPTKGQKTNYSSNSVTELFKNKSFWIGDSSQNLPNIMQQIFYEIEHQYLGYEETLKSLLSLLILSSVRNLVDITVKSPKPILTSSIDTKTLVIDDYFLYEYKTLSLEGLAQKIGLSPRQTERYLKEHYGKTFIQKKTESKMATAALLLSDSSMSITDISEDLGYSSIEHFSTAFKRYYNSSPSEYRKHL